MAIVDDAFITDIDRDYIFFNSSTRGTIALKVDGKEKQFLLTFRHLTPKQVAFEERVCKLHGRTRETGTPQELPRSEWNPTTFARDNADVVPPNFTLEHSHMRLEAPVENAPYLNEVGLNLFDDLLKLGAATNDLSWISYKDDKGNPTAKCNVKVHIERLRPFVGFHSEVQTMVVTFSHGAAAYAFSNLFKNDTFDLRKDIRVHLHAEPSQTAFLTRCGLKLQDRVQLDLSKASKPFKMLTTAKQELVVFNGSVGFNKCVKLRQGVDIQNPSKVAYEYLRDSATNCVYALAVLGYGGVEKLGLHLIYVESNIGASTQADLLEMSSQVDLPITFVPVRTEEHLLQTFVSFVRARDPEFFISVDGFFGSRLSDLFSKPEHIEIAKGLCRINNAAMSKNFQLRVSSKRESAQGAGDTSCDNLKINRAQLDIKHLAIQDFKPEGTDLKTILKTFMSAKSQAACRTFGFMSTELWQTAKEPPGNTPILWLLTLLNVVHQAETDGNIAAIQVAMSGVTNTSITDVQTKGQFARIMNLFYLLGRSKYVLNTKEFVFGNFPRATSNSGGNVVQPVAGFTSALPTFMFDFTSMYPGIMRAHNMCPSNMVREEDLARLRKQGYVINNMISFTRRTAAAPMAAPKKRKKAGEDDEGDAEEQEENEDEGGEEGGVHMDEADQPDVEMKRDCDFNCECESGCAAAKASEFGVEAGTKANDGAVGSVVAGARGGSKNVALHFVQQMPNGSPMQGLTTVTLDLTINQRQITKNLMAKEKDPEKKNFLNVQQNVWKIVCNSVYGLMMLLYPAFGCCVTSMGRLDQAKAIMIITSKDVCKRGLTLRMGDTDSIIASGKLDKLMRERARAVLYELQPGLKPKLAEGEAKDSELPLESEVWARYDAADLSTWQGNQVMQGLFRDHDEVQRLHMAFGVWLERVFIKHYKEPKKLALEHFAINFFLLSKKKQYGVMVYSLDLKSSRWSDGGKLKKQGIGKKRDIPLIFRKFQNGVVQALCKDSSPTKALECFISAVDKIRAQDTPLTDLCFSVQVRLKTDTQDKLVQGTVLKLLKQANYPVSAGDMMRYVFIDKGVKAAESALPVELFDPKIHRLSTEKYLTRFWAVAIALLNGIVHAGHLKQYITGQPGLPGTFLENKRLKIELDDSKPLKKSTGGAKSKKDEMQATLPLSFGGSSSHQPPKKAKGKTKVVKKVEKSHDIKLLFMAMPKPPTPPRS